MQVPCHFLQIPVTQSLTMALYKVQIIKIGQYHKKSRIFNLSLALPISTIASFMDIPKSQFCLCILPTRVPLGIFPMSATLPLKHLQRLSPQLQSLPIGSWTLKLQSRLMPLTTHSLLSFQLQLPMATCTPLPDFFCP